MVKRSRGRISRASRRLGARATRAMPSAFVKEIPIGTKVVVVPNLRYKDFPHQRYKGRIGIVVGLRGSALIVAVDKVKLIARPIHFKVVQ